MKVAIFCNDDLTSNIVFSEVFNLEEIKVAGIYVMKTPKHHKKSILFAALGLLKKMSFRYWIFLVIVSTLFKVFEFVTAAFQLPPKSGYLVSLRRYAELNGIQYKKIHDFSDPDFIRSIQKEELDLLLIRVGAILSGDLISSPKFGTWCLHSSILPSGRGIAGEFHALRHDDLPVGSSLFKVIEKLDEGPVIDRVTINRERSASVYHHIILNNRSAAKLIAKKCEWLHSEKLISHIPPNKDVQSSYFSWPVGSQVRDLRKKGTYLMTLTEFCQLFLLAIRAR